MVSGSSHVVTNMMVIGGYMVVNFMTRRINQDTRKLTHIN